jgi:hypothetical protein
MRTLTGIGLSLVFAGGLFAQAKGGSAPFVAGAPGNAVFPAGTSANNPFITRVPSNVVYPGGGGPHLVVPGTTPRVPRTNVTTPYYGGYSIYVPDYYDASTYGTVPGAAGAVPQQGQQAPNVVVIYPPGSSPMMAPPPPETAHPSMQVYGPDTAPQPATSSDEDTQTSRYLLAFKDHSIYSVVAYWVDGDTIHYFTSGNNHKQAPLSSIDRVLTDRLNTESGSDFKLPPAK